MGNKERNNLCWCGSGLKYKKCHLKFDEKLDVLRREGQIVPSRQIIKNREQVEGIRRSAEINIAVLDYVAQNIREGVTTEEIDSWVYRQTADRGGVPAPLNFEGFPKSVCTSVNDQVCHGIPSPKEILKEGDIINVDVSTIFNGYFSDSSRMFCIGRVSEEKKRLVETTRQCVEAGLKQVKPWGFLGDIGHAVQELAEGSGYSVVREIGGHGVGLEFHEEPWVGFTGRQGTGMALAPGMIFTIEPMINMGGAEVFTDEENGWTVRTADGKPSAQWEIQVLVTETGYEVLAY